MSTTELRLAYLDYEYLMKLYLTGGKQHMSDSGIYLRSGFGERALKDLLTTHVLDFVSKYSIGGRLLHEWTWQEVACAYAHDLKSKSLALPVREQAEKMFVTEPALRMMFKFRYADNVINDNILRVV